MPNSKAVAYSDKKNSSSFYRTVEQNRIEQ